ncbi:hypothetical protein CVD28_11375 [Bacillus sp. M6-12]|nr:hypothetical protein CVD28_11375 [Bacillus sp. M6-12]
MDSQIIMEFQNKGIKIEKTKSRHEVFSNLFRSNPSLLGFQANSLTERLNDLKGVDVKLTEF